MTHHFSLGTCLATALLFVTTIIGCTSPDRSPDQTLAGTVLGAGWGAGAGAVVGNQVSHPGPGAAVGAGFGAVAGMMAGYASDEAEETQADIEKQLASLRIQSLNNHKQLQGMQQSLDRAATSPSIGGIYQVFFDDDASSMRAGAVANLEAIADALRRSPSAAKIEVSGHSDDAGTPDYNLRLSEARARNVASYLAARGISMDQIEVRGFGSTRPLATNTTPEGRQLNRRVDVLISR
jgi:outer membrane protein OmpA-like peptidoglycan-associated protein